MTEAGQSVDSASFGAGPRTHAPAMHAYKDTFVAALSEPNADGGSNFHLAMANGVFTAGPSAGLRFTISEFELKGWSGTNGIKTYGSSETPVIQTVTSPMAKRFSGFAPC